jgi:chaperone protein DnaK
VSPKVLGIDLGTTNSLVAYMDGAQPKVIANREGRTLVPSVVSFSEDGILIGDSAKARMITHPQQTVYSVKRLMGKGMEDLKGEVNFIPYPLAESRPGVVEVRIGHSVYTPPEISSFILKELKKRAEDFFGSEINQVVITVPAYFNDSQRQATKDAGKIAGLEVLRIINEPTAASLAYGLQKKKEGVIAVYDLGGGTFDISILKVKGGIFEVLSTNGNTHLGGDDIDQRLMAVILEEMAKGVGHTLDHTAELLQVVRGEAERAKCRLSFEEQTEIVIPALKSSKEYRKIMTRAEFEGLIGDIIEKSLDPCRQALGDAKLHPRDVDEVVLVGGSTRIPLVRKKVQELFGRSPHCELNPEEVVALGAAVQADILSGGTKDMLLLDVTPLSLGIETLGGVMSVLIPRNTTVPTAAKEIFTTSVDGQTTVNIHVLQGERDLVKDNRSLARFLLKDIDPMPAGMPRIEVTFLIDANGILNVVAKELRSGEEQFIEVKPTYGLTEDEVEQMVEESYQFAESDVRQRMLIESRNEADAIIRHTQKALQEGSDLISEDERLQIQNALEGLKQAKEGEDHGLIRERIGQLDEATQHLAEILMERVVKTTLKGKKIS